MLCLKPPIKKFLVLWSICLIRNEMVVYRLKKSNTLLHYYASHFHSYTCHFKFQQGNACGIIHRLWSTSSHPLPTAQNKLKKTNMPGASVQSFAAEHKERLTCGQPNDNVIYSAYSKVHKLLFIMDYF